MTEQEIIKLKLFIKFYKEIHTDIEDLELQIKEINDRKNLLLHLIKTKRDEENKYLETLKEKYGENVINTESLKKILL